MVKRQITIFLYKIVMDKLVKSVGAGSLIAFRTKRNNGLPFDSKRIYCIPKKQGDDICERINKD